MEDEEDPSSKMKYGFSSGQAESRSMKRIRIRDKDGKKDRSRHLTAEKMRRSKERMKVSVLLELEPA